jgi:AcrR family transcriptional regulator
VPTGVALQDVRSQLFDAAERVLLKQGPSALTSRAVTAEAGVAKGVLHRHFTDFDDFLAEFVLDRRARMAPKAEQLLGVAGTGDVIDNVAAVLSSVFGSVAMAILPLITFRVALRARLRQTWPDGVPILTDAVEMIADYLAAEQRQGRISPDAEIGGLAPMLVGTAHLLYGDSPPAAATLRASVSAVIAPSLAADA